MYARSVAGCRKQVASPDGFSQRSTADPRGRRSFRSKNGEERRTAATNSLQSRVVSRCGGTVTPHLCLCCRCSFPSTCARARTQSFFFYLCVPVAAVASFVDVRSLRGRNASLLPARHAHIDARPISWGCYGEPHTSISFGCACAFIQKSFSTVCLRRVRNHLRRCCRWFYFSSGFQGDPRDWGDDCNGLGCPFVEDV